MSGIAFNESLILEYDQPMTDREVLSAMADYLCEKGIVKNSYRQAVLDREASFPTGLKTGGINVAIPHTDIYHVNQAAICVAILKSPALFQAMDEPDHGIEVNLVIMLALTEAHGHIEMLQRIVKLIQNQEDVKNIIEVNDMGTVNAMIKQHLLEEQEN